MADLQQTPRNQSESMPVGWDLRWTHQPDAPTAVVLLLHGGQADSDRPAKWSNLSVLRMLPFALAARRAGEDLFAVAMIRYAVRGWNGSQASPVGDTKAALETVAAAYPGLPIILVGHSMGGRVALAVADDRRVSDVVGLAPWVVLPEMRSHAGLRTLFVHGVPDRITSARASRKAAESLQAQGRAASFVGLEGENHAMLRRSRTWDQLLRGYLRATVGGVDEVRPSSHLERLGASAAAGGLVTVI